MLSDLASKLRDDQILQIWDILIGESKLTAHAAEGLAPRLTSEQFDQGIFRLEADKKQSDRSEIASLFGKLEPRLTNVQVVRIADLIIQKLQEHVSSTHRYQDLIAKLAPRMRGSQRLQAAETIVASVLRRRLDAISSEFPVFMSYLEPVTHERITSEILLIQLDFHALSEDSFSVYKIAHFRPVVVAMTEPRSLAKLMEHPACVGIPQNWMLQRFEELVLHNGQSVFLIDPNPAAGMDGDSRDEFGGLTPNRSPVKPEPPTRRFHTIHDAAAWIEQNWPDFDLEATMLVTWRGEP